MLILPPGHWQEVAKPRRVRPRDKWVIAAGVGLIAALAIGVGVAFTSVQKTSRNGCIDVSAATVIGGSELYRCGAQARALCSEPGDSGTSNLSFRRALADACRKAGLPVPKVR